MAFSVGLERFRLILFILLQCFDVARFAKMLNSYWSCIPVKKVTKELTLVTIVLWVKELPEYLDQ